jgi:transposase-like protein
MNSENTMMGLPAGYPSKSQVDKIEKKNKEIRKKSTTDSEYVYNIVDEITDDVNNFIDEYFDLPLTEGLLLEGGAAGHLAHPFEDGDLTFNDMKEMIKRGLVGGLDKEAPVTEKLDGQNIAFSFKDGKIIFGRNKGHVRDGGKNALDVKGITQQFAGRGGIEKAFVGAAEDLQSAISKLTPQQTKNMFKNGSKFMSLEIILPDTQNVIPYGKSVLVMHGTIEYNKEGEQINRSSTDGEEFAQAVQKVGADKQKTFGIEGPKVIAFSDAESLKYAKLAKEYNSNLNDIAKQYGLNSKSKLEDYRNKWWQRKIDSENKELNLNLSPKEKQGLVNRWANGDKTFGVKSFSDTTKSDWFRNFETNELQKSQKEMIKPVENIFLNAGAQTLKRVSNFLSTNSPTAAKELKRDTLTAIKAIRDSKDPDKIAKLQKELERLDSIGLDNLVPSEGVVFMYNGNPYKYTGTFAPINQIQGTFKFDKPAKKEDKTEKNEIAIFSGRFQPFHAGHYSIYKSLVDKFGKDNVYISSSNIIDPVKSPFPFKDKKAIMNKMFGIPTNKIIQVKNPYSPVEILSKYPEDTKYVTAVSEKDAERLEQGGKYFKNYDKVPDNKKKGYEDEGYYIIAPEMQLKVNGKNISGTQLRATFGNDLLTTKEKKDIFNQVYPKFDKDVFANIVVTTKKAEAARKSKETTKKGDLKSKIKSLDPKTKKRVDKVLQTKIKNPDTGNTILVKSALKYDDTMRVKKQAVTLVKQAMKG